MSTSASVPAWLARGARPAGVGLLLRVKLRAAGNQLASAVAEAPLRFAMTMGFLVAIWLGLYFLFRTVFEYFQRTPLEAAVAIPLVFSFFFLALLVMLTVSNAIIAYMSLFAAPEAMYLLASPVHPRAYVSMKYIETLVFSSWSLILLGLPLMMAMADLTDEPWYYYPLFLSFFLCFVPIPGAMGLLLAWGVARFLNRDMRRKLLIGLLIVLAITVVWFLKTMKVGEAEAVRWLKQFLFRISLIQGAFLPNAWVSKGVEASMQDRSIEALLYLGVTLANGLFLSWLVLRAVSSRFLVAFDHAQSTKGWQRRAYVEPTAGLPGLVFFYLPHRLRLIAAKDLRTFFRDPLQWTQLVILFGLMILYLVNVPRYAGGQPLEGWGMIIPFLNFGAISFILATFTSRFVFPLVSLEGLQMWLIGMLPLSPRQLLAAKFAFAMTVAAGVAVGTTIVAATMLKMPLPWALLQITVTFAVSFGLCGFAVGFGARLPMFGQRNAARIANGFGGTVNLIASVTLVLAMLVGMAALGIHNRFAGFQGAIDMRTLLIAAIVSAFGIVCGVIALTIGARHLHRAEL